MTRNMVAVGYILFGLGFFTAIAGEVMFLLVAYKRSLLWFFGCLFVPVVCWIFFFLNMKETIKAFVLQVVGLLLAGIGCYLGKMI